jgi:hypothetical protein
MVKLEVLTVIERVVPELVVFGVRYALILGQFVLSGRCKIHVLPSKRSNVNRRCKKRSVTQDVGKHSCITYNRRRRRTPIL